METLIALLVCRIARGLADVRDLCEKTTIRTCSEQGAAGHWGADPGGRVLAVKETGPVQRTARPEVWRHGDFAFTVSAGGGFRPHVRTGGGGLRFSGRAGRERKPHTARGATTIAHGGTRCGPILPAASASYPPTSGCERDGCRPLLQAGGAAARPTGGILSSSAKR